MSKKGRKVYRTNSYEKKKRLKRALRILLGLIVIAALVFVGYSVGKPILNYLNKENENTAALACSPILASGDVTGAVAFLAPNDSAVANEVQQNLIQAAAQFLGKQIED